MKALPKISLLLLLSTMSQIAAAQYQPIKNMPRYDDRLWHFGFFVGLNTYDLQLRPVTDLSKVPDIYGMRTEVNPGYSIGIVSDLRIGKNFNLRFLPSFANTERVLYFDMYDRLSNGRNEVVRLVESSLIMATFELKFKTNRIDNHRWYMLTGVSFAHDLSSKEEIKDDLVFKLGSSDMTYDFGVGMDIYFEYFKLSPQIKAFWGVTDLTVRDGTIPVSGVESTRTRGLLFCFTFE